MKSDIFSVLAGTYSLLNRTTSVPPSSLASRPSTDSPDRTENGIPVPEVAWGSGSNGIMIYGPTGYMSTTVVSTDPSLLPPDLDVTYPFQEGQSDADWAKTGKHTLSYSGPYAIENRKASSGKVIHGPLTVAHVPGMMGTLLERDFAVFESGDGTFLQIVQESGALRSELWWVKLD